MPDVSRSQRHAASRRAGPGFAAWLNLVVPGGGLVLVGAYGTGIIAGLLFAAAANLTVTAVLLFPDDFSGRARVLLIVLLGVIYVGAQVRMVQAARRSGQTVAQRRRREILTAAQAALSAAAAGAEPAPAPAESVDELARDLQTLARQCPQDLLVWVRLTEVLSTQGAAEAARVAGQHATALDRHGLYRAELARFSAARPTEHRR